MANSLTGLLSQLLFFYLASSPTTTLACFTKRSLPAAEADWSYDAVDHWADSNPSYGTCRNGSHQSPIALNSQSLLSNTTTTTFPHSPSFNYTGFWTGNFSHNGNSLKFDLFPSSSSSSSSSTGTTTEEKEDITTLPALTTNNETFYLSSWHTHIPGEHIIDGDTTEAEMHFVHIDLQSKIRAVVAFRLDPSITTESAHSNFFAQLGPFPRDPSTSPRRVESFQPGLVWQDVGKGLVEEQGRYWTYSGSLTTPPCSEGVRWFVVEEKFVLGDGQLQELLDVSRFSARRVQRVWRHGVGV